MDRTGQNETGLADTGHHQNPPSPDSFLERWRDHFWRRGAIAEFRERRYQLSYAPKVEFIDTLRPARNCVYLLKAGGLVKIGFAGNLVTRAGGQLRAGGAPATFLFAWGNCAGDDGELLEKVLQRIMAHRWSHGSWFRIQPHELRALRNERNVVAWFQVFHGAGRHDDEEILPLLTLTMVGGRHGSVMMIPTPG